MFSERFNIIVPVIIAILIMWLMYRIKRRVEVVVKSEIYRSFPSIKNVIDNFEQRINFLKTSVEELESKIAKLKNQDLSNIK